MKCLILTDNNSLWLAHGVVFNQHGLNCEMYQLLTCSGNQAQNFSEQGQGTFLWPSADYTDGLQYIQEVRIIG